MDPVSGLGYSGIKRACRHPVRTFDQVLTVRETRDNSRGDEGGKTKDVPTASSHRFRQLNRKS
jgi:hypothetical protein